MVHVLGNTGLVGRTIEQVLISKGIKFKSYARPHFDITDEKTYSVFKPENDDLVIDCIARIDGKPEEQEKVNHKSFAKWIEYVGERYPNIRYVYFSTYSTLLKEIYEINPYVGAKRKAEECLRKNLTNYKIIRLAFPFGKGEAANRLISRMINRIINNEELNLDAFYTNFTPISELEKDITELLNSDLKEINYASSNLVSMKEIVDHIYSVLQKTPKYNLTDKRMVIEVKDNFKKLSDKNILVAELNKMLDV